MAHTVTIKKSTVPGKIPTAADLNIGELAVNTADGKIYTKHSDNSIKALGGSSSGTGDVFDRYQILDDTNSNTPVAGCFIIATGQVYGRKEGTDNSTGKTLRVKIPTGIKVRTLVVNFTAAEVGTTNKQMYVVFDTSTGYTGMPNNLGSATTYATFMPPQVACYNGTDNATGKIDGLISLVPKFSADGTNRNFNAILCTSSLAAPLFVSVGF